MGGDLSKKQLSATADLCSRGAAGRLREFLRLGPFEKMQIAATFTTWPGREMTILQKRVAQNLWAASLQDARDGVRARYANEIGTQYSLG